MSGLDLALARRSVSLKASSGSWHGGFLPSFSSAHAPSSAAPPSSTSLDVRAPAERAPLSAHHGVGWAPFATPQLQTRPCGDSAA